MRLNIFSVDFLTRAYCVCLSISSAAAAILKMIVIDCASLWPYKPRREWHTFKAAIGMVSKC
jgi:hypothetical protein